MNIRNLSKNPDDIIHVEDGEGQMQMEILGHQTLLIGITTMDANGDYDIISGWSEDARNSQLLLPQNRVETAEKFKAN